MTKLAKTELECSQDIWSVDWKRLIFIIRQEKQTGINPNYLEMLF